ncbi:MAG: tRNA(fMet)-specific endonuclease VapC [Methanonatronarchaeales archaeon]|nr:tRNA(fMet)-specific endonuclease VapC [Methanonatronarchaeales archaeon]
MKYVDVNVLIYWLIDHPEFGDTAREIVGRIEGGERAATSALTPWIIHVVLKNEAENYDRETMLELLDDLKHLTVAELTMNDYLRADELVAEAGFDMEDALHLVTAERLDCDKSYTNDSDFDKVGIDAAFE